LKVPKFRREAPATGEGSQPRRRRRRVRPDAPTTIVPIDGETPSWLHAEAPKPAAAAQRPAPPLALDLDAARERLRRQIPPVDDDQ
jgi:hypothetical protein